MSLKSFHIVFILLCSMLSFGFLFWSVKEQIYLPLGVTSGILGVMLVIYGIWFVRKIRTLHGS